MLRLAKFQILFFLIKKFDEEIKIVDIEKNGQSLRPQIPQNKE